MSESPELSSQSIVRQSSRELARVSHALITRGLRDIARIEQASQMQATAIAPPLVAVCPAELPQRVRKVEAWFPMTETEAKQVQKGAAEALGVPLYEELDLGGGVKIRFVLIPAGRFLMGSPVNELGRGPFENQQPVRLTKAFYMAMHQVTQAQYERVTGRNPSWFSGVDLPVENVAWNEAVDFCEELSLHTGRRLRLPTVAEGEFSCRAGTATPFHFGETISTDQANYDGSNAYGDAKQGENRGKTVAVGSFSPNAWGLYDMHGNVWEWCQDRFGNYPEDEVVDPTGPILGRMKVLRGGAWPTPPNRCRSAQRNWDESSDRQTYWGFRLAMELP